MTKKFDFIRLYFKNLKDRKQALKIIKEKEEYFNEHLKEDAIEIKQEFQDFCQQYDTYSDNKTCYYRKVAREYDFELVGWYKLKNQATTYNNMIIIFDDIEKVECNEPIKLLLVYWDIEMSSIHGPGYFPLAENKQDYVYMIQLDLFWLSESKPNKRYCIISIPIDCTNFIAKYKDQISCDPNNYHIINVDSQEKYY